MKKLLATYGKNGGLVAVLVLLLGLLAVCRIARWATGSGRCHRKHGKEPRSYSGTIWHRHRRS